MFDGHVTRVPVHEVALVHVANVIGDYAGQADLVGRHGAREPGLEEE